MAITSSLYLSTDQVINPPIQKSNLASVTWIVDWDNIFRGHTNGLCKVTCNMVSKKGTGSSDTWDGSVGIMTASFSSPYDFGNYIKNFTEYNVFFSFRMALTIYEYIIKFRSKDIINKIRLP